MWLILTTQGVGKELNNAQKHSKHISPLYMVTCDKALSLKQELDAGKLWFSWNASYHKRIHTTTQASLRLLKDIKLCSCYMYFCLINKFLCSLLSSNSSRKVQYPTSACSHLTPIGFLHFITFSSGKSWPCGALSLQWSQRMSFFPPST